MLRRLTIDSTPTLSPTFFALILLLTASLAAIRPAPAIAESCIDLVPVLTEDASAVSTSGIFDHRYKAWQAFDRSLASMWISEVFETPAWIAYDFGAPRVIDQYTITNTNGPALTSRAPKEFELQGSNDGKTWATVDRRGNQTGWVSGAPRSFRVEKPGSYARYRLYVIDDNDIRDGVVVISIGDLKFESCICKQEPFDLVPTLTGDTPAVSTSGVFSRTYRAWQAFDRSLSTMWISEVFETPAWIGFEFGTGRTVTEYALTNTNGTLTSRAPKDFELQGSNEGVLWVTVDRRANQTDWTSGTPRSYRVRNPGRYTHYRLFITDDNDDRPGVVVISLGNLELRGCL